LPVAWRAQPGAGSLGWRDARAPCLRGLAVWRV